jgi:predicted GIY-YIG superfamily endonuclease
MWYVYIIRSLNHPDQVYTGATANLKQRIDDHNCGKSIHTSLLQNCESVRFFQKLW